MSPEYLTEKIIEPGDSRYFRESRQFFQQILHKKDSWQAWSDDMQTKLEEDFLVAGYDRGIKVPYSAKDFFEAGISYFRYGHTAKFISQTYPGIPANEAITAIRDLAILSFPRVAKNYQLDPSQCKRRSKRIMGIEARTSYQNAYGKAFEKYPEFLDDNSTIVTEWKLVLSELSVPSVNNGKKINIDPQVAVNLVRLTCQKGFNFKMSTDILGIAEIHPTLFRRILFTSLLVLNEISLEKNFSKKLLFEIDESMIENLPLAQTLIALKKEKEKLSDIVEFHQDIYRNKLQKKPYLNPLQVAVLSLYQKNMNYEEIGESIPGLVTSNKEIGPKITSLRNLLSGNTANGETPFASDFQNIVREAIIGDDSSLQTIFKILKIPDPGVDINEFIRITRNEVGGLVLKMSENDISLTVKKRIAGKNIRSIARDAGIGKNLMFDVVNRLERTVTLAYFPAIKPVFDELLGRGRKMKEIINGWEIFDSDPLENFTNEQIISWKLVQSRRRGVSANQLIEQGISEIKISELTDLAIITAIHYEREFHDNNSQPEGEHIKGKSFEIKINHEAGQLQIGENIIHPSHRELSLFNSLCQNHGTVTYASAFSLLYPGEIYIGTGRQKEDLRLIVCHLNERLGEDVRENPSVNSINPKELITLNSKRIFIEKDKLLINYRHSPFGSIKEFNIEQNLLRIKYADYDHDRLINLSSQESKVLNILQNKSSGGWSSLKSVAASTFENDYAGSKMSRIGDLVSRLKRKLCVPYPLPGHVLSDNVGNLRIITYEDYLTQRYYFKTNKGLFYLNPSTFAVVDDLSEKTITRLGVGEARNFLAMCMGTTGVEPTVKWQLINKLIGSEIIEAGGAYDRLEKEIEYLGQTEDSDWKHRIRMSDNSLETTINILRQDGTQMSVGISEKEKVVFFDDPLNPKNFTNHQKDILPNIEGVDEFGDAVKLARLESLEFPLLNIEGEHVLLMRMTAGDKDARNRLFRSNMRLSFKEAYRSCLIQNDFSNFIDVVQEGYLGLNKALDKFDIRKNVEGKMIKFSTYATWWIRQGTTRFFENQCKNIRIPVRQQEFSKLVRNMETEFSNLGEKVTPETIAYQLMDNQNQRIIDESQTPLEQIVNNDSLPVKLRTRFNLLRKKIIDVQLQPRTISLDAQNNSDDERSLSDTTSDPRFNTAELAEESVDDGLKNDLVKKLLQKLPSRSADILKYKYGLYDGVPHSLEETGKKYGVTKERIRQIEVTAIQKMRDQNDDETNRLIRGYSDY